MGIAALDLNGSLVLLTSRKNISQSGITDMITKTGRPVIISTDMRPPPRIIEKIAASLGSRLIYPESLLSKRDKLSLVKDFVRDRELKKNPWKNQHEKDALASALHAWGRIRPLVRRINTKTAIYAVLPYFPELNSYVKSRVIVKGTSISRALKEYLGRRKE